MKRLFQITSIMMVVLLMMVTLSRMHVSASTGSMIGPIDVSDLSKKEMNKYVQQEVSAWQQRDIAIQGGLDEITISGEIFNFDVKRSVEHFQQAQKGPWYDFWSPKPEVQSELIVHASEELSVVLEPIANGDIDKMIEDILLQVSMLPTRPLKITQTDFNVEDGQLLSTITLPIKTEDMNEMTKMAEQLDELLLEPQAEFSFFQTVGKTYKAKNANLVATALYSNALHGGFDISQRQQANYVQSYISAGYEATVDVKKSQDLVFTSTREGLVKLSATLKNNEFILSFYIPKNEELPRIVLYIADEQSIEPRIIYRYSDELLIGESEEVRQSKEGTAVSVYRKTTTVENGTEEKLISANYYAPIHQIILKSMEESTIDDSITDDSTTNIDEDTSFTEEDTGALDEELTDLIDEEHFEEIIGNELTDKATKGDHVTEEGKEQLIDRNKFVIIKVENPTEEELADENLVYSETDDSYYFVHAVDSKAEGEK